MSHTDTGGAIVEAAPAEVFESLVDRDARTSWLPPEGMTGRARYLADRGAPA